MLGKVWSTGALQVVQNVAIIPQSVHPRNKLDSTRPPPPPLPPFYISSLCVSKEASIHFMAISPVKLAQRLASANYPCPAER